MSVTRESLTTNLAAIQGRGAGGFVGGRASPTGGAQPLVGDARHDADALAILALAKPGVLRGGISSLGESAEATHAKMSQISSSQYRDFTGKFRLASFLLASVWL